MTDYERYIQTDQLLSLQKPANEQVNHDELLFQVTHQTAELWMKAYVQDVTEAERLLQVAMGQTSEATHEVTRSAHTYSPVRRAIHLFRRAAHMAHLLAQQVLLLERMAPADYHQIRTALGRGSGQDSPGFNRILALAAPVADSYRRLFTQWNLTPRDVLADPYQHGKAHDLVQALLELDEQFMRFRQTHLHLVRRQIGLDVLSLKGVPAAKLTQGAQAAMFPDLWDAVCAVTNGMAGSY